MTSRRGLEIRAATVGDAPGLCELLNAIGLAISTSDMASRIGALRQGAGTALLAVEWGPPSGVIVLHWFETLLAPQPIAQITMLLVGVEERRRGIGRLLVKAATQAARVAGCGALEFSGSASADDLHAFCLATGFTEAGPIFSRALRKNAGA